MSVPQEKQCRLVIFNEAYNAACRSVEPKARSDLWARAAGPADPGSPEPSCNPSRKDWLGRLQLVAVCDSRLKIIETGICCATVRKSRSITKLRDERRHTASQILYSRQLVLARARAAFNLAGNKFCFDPYMCGVAKVDGSGQESAEPVNPIQDIHLWLYPPRLFKPTPGSSDPAPRIARAGWRLASSLPSGGRGGRCLKPPAQALPGRFATAPGCATRASLVAVIVTICFGLKTVLLITAAEDSIAPIRRESDASIPLAAE